jgi:hypothetical protein
MIRSLTKNLCAAALIIAGLAAFATKLHSLPQRATGEAISAKLDVAPDLAQRVAKFERVKMPFHSEGLTAREKKMVEKLVDAGGLLDCIFWRQSDPQGLKLYLSLEKSTNPQDVLLRRYLKINGGRFELINGNQPFVGTEPMPPGRGLYAITVDYEPWVVLGP